MGLQWSLLRLRVKEFGPGGRNRADRPPKKQPSFNRSFSPGPPAPEGTDRTERWSRPLCSVPQSPRPSAQGEDPQISALDRELLANSKLPHPKRHEPSTPRTGLNIEWEIKPSQHPLLGVAAVALLLFVLGSRISCCAGTCFVVAVSLNS